MDAHTLATLLSYSVVIPTIAALTMIRKASITYLPFFLCLFVGCITELISTFFIRFSSGNAINANFYVLIEFGLLLWLFYNWNPSLSKKTLYTYLGFLLTAIWITETLVINQPYQFSVYYRAAYAFIIVLLSGDQLGFILMHEKNIFTNTRFILCASFLIQFSYKAFFETLFVVNPPFSIEFYRQFFLIWSVVNAAANLIYIPAVLWIPRKERYYITSS